MTAVVRGLLDRLAALERPYFAIDGGSGAALLAQLPTVDDRLRPAKSPRHADLLVVVEPVTERLLDAVLECYRSLAHPRRVVVAGACGADRYGKDAPLVRLEDHLPVAFRVEGAGAAESVGAAADALARAMRGGRGGRTVHVEIPERAPEEILIPLRSSAEQEIATEDVVLSVGPVQSATAGPLRLLLLMDGEQIVRVEVRSGYAAREIERLAVTLPWAENASLAAALDPLAPISGRVAYLQALESLHGIVPPPRAQHLREIALGIERATSHLFWFARFTGLLAYGSLTAEARRLAVRVAAMAALPAAIVPGGWRREADPWAGGTRVPEERAEEVRRFAHTVRSDRLFGLRTRGIGRLAADRAREVGASGPVLRASERAEGDARARALARLEAAAEDLEQAAALLARLPTGAESARWPGSPPPVGAAESQVAGPRGTLTLQLESDARERPAGVHWARPSAVHLGLIPELVLGCTLNDALTAVASLDLCMAEADG